MLSSLGTTEKTGQSQLCWVSSSSLRYDPRANKGRFKADSGPFVDTRGDSLRKPLSIRCKISPKFKRDPSCLDPLEKGEAAIGALGFRQPEPLVGEVQPAPLPGADSKVIEFNPRQLVVTLEISMVPEGHPPCGHKVAIEFGGGFLPTVTGFLGTFCG